MSQSNNVGSLLAVAAATLIVSGCASTTAGSNANTSTAMVHCNGVNECKGHSACATNNNACAGKNACKGQGFVSMTAADCAAAGGTL